MSRVCSVDRRRFSKIDMILSIIFLISVIVLVFWIFKVHTNLGTVQNMQGIILEGNQKNMRECNSVKKEVKVLQKETGKVQEKLESIYSFLLER